MGHTITVAAMGTVEESYRKLFGDFFSSDTLGRAISLTMAAGAVFIFIGILIALISKLTGRTNAIVNIFFPRPVVFVGWLLAMLFLLGPEVVFPFCAKAIDWAINALWSKSTDYYSGI